MWILGGAMGDLLVVDAATAVHHTATVDETWDGPAAVKAMPAAAATLKYCHAWVDPDGDPDAKSSYKFPHHRTKGGPANLAACRNGLARLSGSSIPDGDKAGVKRHLQAHLDDGAPDDLADLAARLRTTRPIAKLRQGQRDWYRIENNAGDTAAVHIYDEIGFWGITAADFIADLRTITAGRIDLHLNTPGGEVFDGIAIMNALRSHPAEVTVTVDSLAASIGSVIAQAGDRRIMARNSTMMIHEGSGLCIGNAQDMRDLADLLDRISDNIAAVYADRAGGDPADWRALMRAETWYTAEEAVAAGLADEVAAAPARTAPPAAWDLTVFNYAGRDHAPAPVTLATQPQPTAPTPPPFDAAATVAALRKARA